MEQEILYLFNVSLARTSLDPIFVFLTNKGYLLFLPIIVYLVLIERDRTSAIVSLVIFFIIFALNDWISNEVKSLIQRPRPCLTIDWIRDIIGCSNSFSMPSNHASNASASAAALYYYMGKAKTSLRALRALPIVIALFISLSRLYLGVHYPSDVLAGIIIGISVAVMVIIALKALLSYYQRSPVEAILLFLIIGMSLFRIYYIRHGGMDLSPDEAHYWEWSRRLDWSYYSKGPLVAWMIKVGTLVFGNTVMAIRLNGVILMALSGILIYKLTKDIFMDAFQDFTHSYGNVFGGSVEFLSKQAGLLAFVLMQTIPLFSTFGIVFTIDSPLIFFWTASLYLLWHIKDTSNPLRQWALLGITVGLGMLAKYTMVFFIGCTFIYLVLYDRKTLLKPYPYTGIALSIVVFSPVILWNYKYDWLTLKHTANMANIDAGLVIEWRYIFEFIGSQIGIVSPLLFFMLIVSLFKIRGLTQGRLSGFLMCFCIPVLLFFLIKSVQGKVQANWAMTGYITAIITFSLVWIRGMYFGEREAAKGQYKRLLTVALPLAMLINVIGLYPQLLNLPAKYDPSARLRGWSMLASEIDKSILNRLKKDVPLIIFTPDYQLSSELAFYLRGNPVTYCINLGRRMNQYDLWESPNNAISRIRKDGGMLNGLFVSLANVDITEAVISGCEGYERHTIEVTHKNRFLRSYNILICYNLSALPDVKTQRY